MALKTVVGRNSLNMFCALLSLNINSNQTFTCLKSTIETLKKNVIIAYVYIL